MLMLQCRRGCDFWLIYWKMAVKRSESEGSSDDGGRRGQQQRRLWLLCNFVAAGGVGCSKGAAIAEEGSSGIAEEGSSGMERETAAVVFNLLLPAIKIVGSERLLWADVNRLQRKIAAGSFLPQGSLLATIKENGSKRSLLAALGSERCVLRLKG
ncbi:hypothetical protein BHM03_00034920 [Ensete ventricosum]|nr:hypothetical protein BHM03_00034920 [Ensete ventricosum]